MKMFETKILALKSKHHPRTWINDLRFRKNCSFEDLKNQECILLRNMHPWYIYHGSNPLEGVTSQAVHAGNIFQNLSILRNFQTRCTGKSLVTRYITIAECSNNHRDPSSRGFPGVSALPITERKTMVAFHPDS